MDADRIVRDFCAAFDRGDVDAIVDAFTDDAVYHNIPMQPCRGKQEIRQFLAGLLGGMAKEIRFDIRHQLVEGLTVMNERVDTIVMADREVALPVCGVFELAPDGSGKAEMEASLARYRAARAERVAEHGAS